MNSPGWTEVLAADSALWAAIFAGLGFLATVGGVVVAAQALRWARKAASEAGVQAEAALRALEWSQKAADATQKQVGLIEKQIEMSEPRPVVNVVLQYADTANRVNVEFKNLGEALAFDVQLSSIVSSVDPIANVMHAVRFQAEAYLQSSETRTARLTIPYKAAVTSAGQIEDISIEGLLIHLGAEQLIREQSSLRPREAVEVRPLTLAYKNARGRRFQKNFVLVQHHRDNRFEIVPNGSLVET